MNKVVKYTVHMVMSALWRRRRQGQRRGEGRVCSFRKFREGPSEKVTFESRPGGSKGVKQREDTSGKRDSRCGGLQRDGLCHYMARQRAK